MMNQRIIDTNIILRHLLQDIPEQSETATAIINDIEDEKITGLVSILVINELIWILENYYSLKRNIFIPKLIKLLQLNHLKIIEAKKEQIAQVLEKMRKKKIDFTDFYLKEVRQDIPILSFDKDFKRL